ncbi:MAG TPA: hypothetical protein VFH95_01705 [Candidatus Kapabacteria bacterium]|nr:hypothetical protein [Candidatus Kapabacteria bacterium]
MRKSLVISFFILPAAFLFSSCVGPNEQDTPANAIVRSYAALSAQDSASYMETLSHDKAEVYEALPAAQHALFDRWKGQHADVKVLSVKQDNGVATVLYNLNVTGREPATQDSLVERTYREDAGWKVGY